jgi:hypothetical protein
MASLALAAAGTQYKIVVPNALADVEGNSASGQTYESVVNIPFRLQVVYPAQEFSALPDSEFAITGFFGRPDATATPRSGEMANVRIRAATTDKEPGGLSTLFAANLGSDVMTVFDGRLPLATQAVGPPGGPQEFDYYYPFDTPYLYDPGAGRNLLIDSTTTSGYSFVVLHDSETASPVRSVFSYGAPNSSTGSLYDNITVIQFVFEEVSPADFNLDLTVDHLDLALWQAGYGYPGGRAEGDADKDGVVTGADFLVWQREYVAGVPGLADDLGIPEPSTGALALFGLCAWGARKRRF